MLLVPRRPGVVDDDDEEVSLGCSGTRQTDCVLFGVVSLAGVAALLFQAVSRWCLGALLLFRSLAS